MVFEGSLVGTLRALAGALVALGIVAGIGGMPVGPASAGIRESAFFIAPDGASVVFDVRDVPRREVVDRLLAGRAVVLEWLDDALADEPITGVFNGSAEAVLQRLLAQANFVVVYDRSGDQPRISRLTILGKAAKQHRAPDLAGPGPLPAPGTTAPAEERDRLPATTSAACVTPFLYSNKSLMGTMETTPAKGGGGKAAPAHEHPIEPRHVQPFVDTAGQGVDSCRPARPTSGSRSGDDRPTDRASSHGHAAASLEGSRSTTTDARRLAELGAAGRPVRPDAVGGGARGAGPGARPARDAGARARPPIPRRRAPAQRGDRGAGRRRLEDLVLDTARKPPPGFADLVGPAARPAGGPRRQPGGRARAGGGRLAATRRGCGTRAASPCPCGWARSPCRPRCSTRTAPSSTATSHTVDAAERRRAGRPGLDASAGRRPGAGRTAYGRVPHRSPSARPEVDVLGDGVLRRAEFGWMTE